MSCNKDCIETPFTSQYICSGTNETKCEYTSNITNLDTALLPKGVVNMVQRRNKHALVKYVQNHPALYFKTYNFSQMLKFNYNLVGRNKVGCCYKMLWITNSGKRFVSFNDMANLYTYTIRFNKTSNTAFYISTVLGSLQKLNLARQMIGNNKYYPYQNVVKNMPNVCVAKGSRLINCNAFNKLGFPNYNKLTVNEYYYWFRKNNIFTPYKKLNMDSYDNWLRKNNLLKR